MDWINTVQKQGLMEGSYEYGNTLSGSIKCYEILA
jgi:hypothetical protein